MGKPFYVINGTKFVFDHRAFQASFLACYEKKKDKKEVSSRESFRQEFGQTIGVDDNTIKDWYYGRHLPQKTDDVLKAAEYLGTDKNNFLIAKEKGAIMSTDTYDTKSVMPLEAITSIDNLLNEIGKVINLVEIDAVYEKTIRRLLRLQLIELLGYDIYYFCSEHKKDEDWPLDWSLIASDVEMVLDVCDTIPISNQNKDFPFIFKDNLYACKVEFIAYLIGGELFEDTGEDSYSKSVGKKAYNCGYELLNILPKTDNALITSYKAALLSLRDVLEDITLIRED
ncbi:MAG: hypothetical protein K6E47_13145 [Lachnospiraceae bacterium]|nr:hypothetical protein [Lachnospiraceae bacterium]